MGKITVKHYLNTNLKPYVINGEKYYSIYVLVTANRQNTKIKSVKFNELYTENDFEEIIAESNPYLIDEIAVITNISNLIIESLGEFDTSFFSALYGFLSNVFVFNLDIQIYSVGVENGQRRIDLYAKDKNALGIAIDQYFCSDYSLSENRSNGMSLFTWFSDSGQQHLDEFLTENSDQKYEISEIKSILNKLIYYACLDKFQWVLKGSKKLEPLYQKYSLVFENDFALLFEDITNKYGYFVDQSEIDKSARMRYFDKI